jgi:hypothetical protein
MKVDPNYQTILLFNKVRVAYRDEDRAGFLVGLSCDLASRLILKLMRFPPPDGVTGSGWALEWLETFFLGISSQTFASFFLLGVVTIWVGSIDWLADTFSMFFDASLSPADSRGDWEVSPKPDYFKLKL